MSKHDRLGSCGVVLLMTAGGIAATVGWLAVACVVIAAIGAILSWDRP